MAKKSQTPVNYPAAKAELESILLKMQQEDLDIDEATKLYERGLELITGLEQYLSSAQNRIVELKLKFGGAAGKD